MKFLISLLLLMAPAVFAAPSHVTADAAPRWIMVTPVTLPVNATNQSLAPWVDGWFIVLHSADGRSGQVATDTTTCTTAPCAQTSSFLTLDSDLTAATSYATMTCGASLRNNAGHPCYISFTLMLASDQSSYNYDTPSWVASQAWATTVGSAPQDFGFCTGYPQDGSASPLPPVTGIANINTTNCGSGSTQCTAATVVTGIPAPWETPVLTYEENWVQQFFTYLKTASYLSQVKYVNIHAGYGSENKTLCDTISTVAGTGFESLLTPATDAELKTVFNNSVSSLFSFAAGLRSSMGLNFALCSKFAMPTDLSSAATTDPSWALLQAGVAATVTNGCIGSNGWKNYSGTSGSDMIEIVGSRANCVAPFNGTGNCTSTNWSNAIPSVYGKVSLFIAQLCNTTTPAGGTGACQDASQSGTGSQADTLWQFLTLAASAGVNVIEMNAKDAQCIGNVSPLNPCGDTSAIQQEYQGAAQAFAQGQIPITH